MDNFVIFITIVGFLVAIPQFWGDSWQGVWKLLVDKSIPWEQVQEAQRNLVEKLNDSGFFPTVIIGIGREGNRCRLNL